MRKAYLSLLCLGAVCSAFAQKAPATRKEPVTDKYFNLTVTDNYRWLENLESQEVKDWFKVQGDFTDQILNDIPGRDSLVNTLFRYDALKAVRIGNIIRKNGRYFYKKTLPNDNIGKLYYRQGKTGPEVLLFDPSTYEKGKKYAISYFKPSEDGKKVALGVAEGGAELSTIRVLNVETRQFYPESIFPSFFGVTGWNPDNTGFLYTPEHSADVLDINRSQNNKSKYHVVGTDPKQDREIFSAAKYSQLGIKPNEIPFVVYTNDFRYVIANLVNVDRRMNAYIVPASDLLKPTVNWKRLAAPEDSVIGLASVGDQLYLQSIKGARKGRILVTNMGNPNVGTAAVVLPEGKDKIDEITSRKDYVFVTLSDGINMIAQQLNTKTNRWEPIKLPFSGTAYMAPLQPQTNDCLIYMMSWTKLTTLFEYDPVAKKTSVSPFHIDAKYPGVDDLVVEEVEVPSHDGTMVPLSIIYNRNVRNDGSAVCFMTGYGAYGRSADPSFSALDLVLLNKGVIVAVSHVRGGGEKGQDWYKAGYKTTKPNTWKDFIACGEYLIKNRYTSVGKLIGEGTSAGGILIGRAITERPDLFVAAISNVGLNNILRAESSPGGIPNTPEFGTVKDSVECMSLYEMDAMHHVKEGVKYPAVISVAGMNDPRVVAWQPAKFAAALQNATTSGKPVLLQVNYDNGHFTEDKQVAFRNFANMYAFALWQAGHPEFQRKQVVEKK